MGFISVQVNTAIASVQSIGKGCLLHICIKRRISFEILLQTANFIYVQQKLFLTGTEASGLTAILGFMEQRMRGECA